MKEMVLLIEDVISRDGEFRLYPRGTSMLPLIRQGKDSVVLVKPGLLSKNDIVLYRRRNDKYVLHRIVKKKGNDLFLCGDNQSVIETGITVDMVVAKVKGVYIDEDYYEGNKGNRNLYYFELFLRRNFKQLFYKIKSVTKNPSKIWRKLKGERR